MIDKSKRGDYEKFMRKWSRFVWIIGGVLLWAILTGGCQPSGPKVQDGNPGQGGETLDLKSLLSQGRTTAIDFYSPYCQPCLKMAPVMEKLAARMPEIAFFKLNINRKQVRGIDWSSPLAQQYRLKSVPYFMIFNPKGKLVAEGPEAQKMIMNWLQKAGLAS